MIAILTDEDFNGRIIRGLRRRLPQIDLVTVTGSDLASHPDADVLEWAARRDRVLLTHDRNTMTAHAIDRIHAAQPMPCVIIVPRHMSIGDAIADLLLIAMELEPQKSETRSGICHFSQQGL